MTVKFWIRFLVFVMAVAAGTASAEAEFAACVPGLQQRALAAGVTPATVNDVLAKVQYVPRVIELDRRQPEFSETFHNYLNVRVSEDRINRGRQMLAQHRALLTRLQKEYGVPPQYLMAFWGLETNYGSYLGNMPVLDSLATLACDARRSEFFTLELIQALKMVDEKIVTPERFVGSWAGAVGNMQFMPTAYRAYAVDGDGDGRADLWRSVPDAMASAARYLQRMGWAEGERWGREVLLPARFDYALTGLGERQPLSFWRKQGVTMTDGTALPDLDMKASILVPAGHTGPAFIVYDNFNVIMRWNRSEFYAIAVGHLADRINGAGGLKRPPAAGIRLTLEQIRQLQAALNEAGFNTGVPDGILGSGTRKAIREFQKSRGMIADGFPSEAVFTALGVDLSEVREPLPGVTLKGRFIQGGLVIGQAQPGTRVRFQDRALPVSEEGVFVFGFNRDDPSPQQLQITLPGGESQTVSLPITKRSYQIQRVTGVPPRTVNPDPKDMDRIRQEQAAVGQAREVVSLNTFFRNRFIWPVNGRMTGVYGSQRIYNGEPRSPHFGLDLAVPEGTPVLAPADAVVSMAYEDMFFSGNTIVLDHGMGISTSYLHLSKMRVKTGDVVKQGDVIGEVGATGRATGPHLCWRLNWFQSRLDPQLLMSGVQP